MIFSLSALSHTHTLCDMMVNGHVSTSNTLYVSSLNPFISYYHSIHFYISPRISLKRAPQSTLPTTWSATWSARCPVTTCDHHHVTRVPQRGSKNTSPTSSWLQTWVTVYRGDCEIFEGLLFYSCRNYPLEVHIHSGFGVKVAGNILD